MRTGKSAREENGWGRSGAPLHFRFLSTAVWPGSHPVLDRLPNITVDVHPIPRRGSEIQDELLAWHQSW
jgi:hypothetical protein